MDVVLLSGGIDSLVCAEMARRSGDLAGCVFVDYGHPAQIPEGWKAFAYCGSRGVNLKVVHVFGLDLGDMATAAGSRVVPGRNAVLLSAAANVARGMGGTRLLIGCNAADQADYEDCRPHFLHTMGRALGIEVAGPLVTMHKAGIVEQARAWGLRKEDAWSCYTAGPTPCGSCPSCLEAERAWTGALLGERGGA